MIRKLWLILLVLPLALLSGCGGDGDSLSGGTGDTGGTGGTGGSGGSGGSGGTGGGGTTTPIVTTGTGNAVSAQVTVTTDRLFVKDTGKTGRAGINVQVFDNSGSLINNADAGIDNVRITMSTRPYGGESLTGLNAAGSLDSTTDSDSTIDVRTSSGVVNVDLNAGTLPGPVEISVEVLDDSGASFSPPLAVTLPQVIIVAGPPHTIAISQPRASVENLRNGYYRAKAGISVTDRHGNAVPDGTPVYLGLIDSVLAHDTDGATTAATAALADADGPSDYTTGSDDFSLAYVVRDGITRFIESRDRVLVFSGNAADRQRYVASAPTAYNTLPLTSGYNSTAAGLEYVVGASLLGSVITGLDNPNNTEINGRAITELGLTELYITYPANSSTIHVGCTDASDQRHLPAGSADVYVVATSSDNRVTTISDSFCFNSLLPWKLHVSQDAVVGSQTQVVPKNITIYLTDGGDSVPLPYVLVTATSDNGSLVSATDCTTGDGVSGPAGTCTSTITIQPGASGDTATVTYSVLGGADAATATVSISIP